MSKLGIAFAVSLFVAASYGVGRLYPHPPASGVSGRKVLYYTDPMHPSYRSDKPGTAPDCGMALEPVYETQPATAALAFPPDFPAGEVRIEKTTQQSLGISLATATKAQLTRTLRTVGRVVPEDSRVYRVNAGVDGLIRETFHDSQGTFVKQDEKLASYFSPDFLSIASGFLAASERVPGSTGNDGSRTVPFPGAVAKQGVSSLQGYADRLRNLGMSDLQIRNIAETRKLPVNIDIVAPIDGFILSRNVSPGQHFTREMEFYRIADLSVVWIIAEVPETETGNLHAGSRAWIEGGEGQPRFPATVTQSLPEYENRGGTAKLRLEVPNRNLIWRPDRFVSVEFPVTLAPTVTVPRDSVVESGTRARVYVQRDEQVFEPREVETGVGSDDRVQILKGLRAGERVASGATFLVDSESRLRSISRSGK